MAYSNSKDALRIPRTPLESRQGYHPKGVCKRIISIFYIDLNVISYRRMTWYGGAHQLDNCLVREE